jgi:hypothetical protein
MNKRCRAVQEQNRQGNGKRGAEKLSQTAGPEHRQTPALRPGDAGRESGEIVFKYLTLKEALSVMIVCVRGEERRHEAYVQAGKPYISLALDYYAVAGLPFEMITVVCKDREGPSLFQSDFTFMDWVGTATGLQTRSAGASNGQRPSNATERSLKQPRASSMLYTQREGIAHDNFYH